MPVGNALPVFFAIVGDAEHIEAKVLARNAIRHTPRRVKTGVGWNVFSDYTVAHPNVGTSLSG